MGCKFACVCSGVCPGCTFYKKEKYIGHAEDVYNQTFDNQENDRQAYEDSMRKDYEEKMLNHERITDQDTNA